MARARADLPAETLGQTVRGVAPAHLHVWGNPPRPADPGALEAFRRLLDAADILGTERGSTDQSFVHTLVLSLPAGLGAVGEETVRDVLHGWHVSDDVAHYGGGAALVLCPDHERLGRTAAEAGRRLLRREPLAGPLVVQGAQVLVDLDACDAQGIRPPLTFLAGAMTHTTTLAFTMTAGHTLTAGQILKIDSELFNVSTVSTNTITPIKRGDNGSTAATHLISATVYIWKPQEDARAACLEMANTAYQRRFGKNIGESARVTAAGVVLSPLDVPKLVDEFISIYRRTV